jgi:hypothetical protein
VLARTLVELADTLVDDFDVVELLTLLTDRCVEVLNVAAAGLMLVAPKGTCGWWPPPARRCVWSSCLSSNPRKAPARTTAPANPCSTRTWPGTMGFGPRFGPVALEAGFRSVHAIPRGSGHSR